MASRGDIALVFPLGKQQLVHRYQTQYRPFDGNGPITNTGLTAATLDGLIILNNSGGTRIDATRADPSTGIWSFYDLSIGRYAVTDVTNNGQWFIDVEADGTFTVTENPGAPVTVAWASA